ncbi:hypothetical protein [Pandoraea communis]|uniref:hypothetical protein n=1 Tax=Pandoraea communis TaxID=2508297 RepID=UPI0025A5AA75|nr:hypothetical protein [Pandoraea communis]MDM8356044.1 hypothetical protein [Pandoraea communis]
MHIKVRFFLAKLNIPNENLISRLKSAAHNHPDNIEIEEADETSGRASISIISSRLVTIFRRNENGEISTESIDTLDQTSINLLTTKKGVLISAISPPRGAKYIEFLLEALSPNDLYFYEPLEITDKIIKKHVSKFEVSKLVSAKIRDFSVYDGAVGRLEIASKNGLTDEIAPFLIGKNFKIDTLTYEISHRFSNFSISYSSNGTVKFNKNHIDQLLSSFERIA